jgi:hypothetical protein
MLCCFLCFAYWLLPSGHLKDSLERLADIKQIEDSKADAAVSGSHRLLYAGFCFPLPSSRIFE